MTNVNISELLKATLEAHGVTPKAQAELTAVPAVAPSVETVREFHRAFSAPQVAAVPMEQLLWAAEHAQQAAPAPRPVPVAVPVTPRPVPVAAALTPAQQTLQAHGILAAWDLYTLPGNAPVLAQFEERTVADIVARLVRWGSISPKQAKFVGDLLARIANRPAVAAQRAQEAAAAADVIEGRREFTGEVVSTKFVESRFGTQFKMLLKLADGSKLWGTVPAGLGDVSRGDIVTLTGTVERSKDDAKFGFYSRPTGATVVRKAVAA